MQKRREIFLILHNIRSLHNVGSIFRTADAAGVSKIFLTGYTPAPLDIFGKYRKEISKVALGAEKYLPWGKVSNIRGLTKKLKKDGVEIIALEQSRNAMNFKKFRPNYPLALILGNEVRGIAPAVLKKCDKIIQIPMRGKKESLNVSVAAGVALFSL
ncbi:RNA methyltransferase [Candidatus Giovannonibacteria bacterium]|nr:RNA methyltransferase [Candidatus Giovannonibacteria bacterium]